LSTTGSLSFTQTASRVAGSCTSPLMVIAIDQSLHSPTKQPLGGV
jgi:hypothetical protein